MRLATAQAWFADYAILHSCSYKKIYQRSKLRGVTVTQWTAAIGPS